MWLWVALVSSVGVASAAAQQDVARGSSLTIDDVHDASFEAGNKCGCANGCAMQKWMKSSMTAAVSSGDGAKIGKALDHVASKAPAGYADWSKIAAAGAEKARSGDIKAAKDVACKACHEKYQDQFVASKGRCDPW